MVTRITMEQFVELVERHPDRHFDFNADGEVIEVSPKRVHSRLQARLARVLIAPAGYEVLTECAHDLNGWPCRPDVSIDRIGDEAIPTTAPLLAVEIKSDSNSDKDLRAKARRYLEHGTRMVWLVFPEKRIVEVYQPDADDQILTLDDALDGGVVLAGFRLALRDLFAE